MVTSATIEKFTTELNDLSPELRRLALQELRGLAEQGVITLPPETEISNLHCHTFFSFNAYGYSPTGLAWLAKQKGIKLLGIVDFDVLDGVDEFLESCELIGQRGSAGMETRAFLPEFADREINSPGEPGVYYTMGIGFASGDAPVAVLPILDDLRQRAACRNREMLSRLNAYLDPLVLDYDRDILPLTPRGNATERHMLAAYTRAAEEHFPDPATFWAEKLALPLEQVIAQISDAPKFQNTIRAKLMKRGGVGYVQPGPGTFPAIEDVNRLVIACGAIPCAAWLDGLSPGEQAIEELLDLLIAKGVAALNIVPDRNWNIADTVLKYHKLENLYNIVRLAGELDLPLNVGTEMNAHGLKLVDDFDTTELLPVRRQFMDGAYFVYGHTMLQRASRLGYQSNWAQSYLPTRHERNAFYTRAGRLISPGAQGLHMLREISPEISPQELISKLS